MDISTGYILIIGYIISHIGFIWINYGSYIDGYFNNSHQ